MLRKNDRIPLFIESVANSGNGVGHHDSFAVFVPFAAPEDELIVRVVKVMKTYCFARIESVVKPSPFRIRADCPHFTRCGGCSFRHVSYERELYEKERWVNDALRRIGGLSAESEPIRPAPQADRYRNKAVFPFGTDESGVFCGLYARRSHRIIPAGSCPLHPAVFTEIAEKVCLLLNAGHCSVYDERTGRGLLRRLCLRRGDATGEIMLCLVISGPSLPGQEAFARDLCAAFPEITSVFLNINTKKTNVVFGRESILIHGKPVIADRISGISVELSPLSFYQVNHDAAEILYQIAAECARLGPSETLLDLYCGTGTIGLSMVKKTNRLIGVEIEPSAVDNARKNARLAGIPAVFLTGSASEAAGKLQSEHLTPDVVVLDPPRKGSDSETIASIAAMSPSRIVMISCNPSTMARDLKRFDELGYSATRVCPVDLFPRTNHVETVCLLSKLNAKQHIEVELNMDEMDLTSAESKATHEEIREYVFEHTGLKVSHLYIAQIKRKYGIIERYNYNLPKSEDAKQPVCPPEKEKAITEALRFFGMI